ncbi:ATP-binding protein, partial [bacterium]|nr:ATP-binding protein [bacterium]
MKAEYFAPEPIDLLESNRNLGYTIEEAIADLIDNSISAECSEVNIECRWNNGTPYLAIADNGHGMDEDTLINSFK